MNPPLFKMKNKEKFVVYVFLMILMSALIVCSVILIKSTKAEECTEDICVLNITNETKSVGYTYEDNLADPYCWYNLNFCNVGYNSSNEFGGGAYELLALLKQVNYQMQDDLNSSRTDLEICNRDLSNANITKYITIGLAILITLIFTYIFLKIQMKGGEK